MKTMYRIAGAIGLIALALGLSTGCTTTFDSDPGAGGCGAGQTDRCASCAELASGSWDGPMLATSACPGPERVAYDNLATCLSDAPQCQPACPVSIGQVGGPALNYISVQCRDCLLLEGCAAELTACGLGPQNP